MIEFKKAYTTLMVADLEKSVEFYVNTLGLYEDLRFGNSWAEVITKGLTLGIHPRKEGHPALPTLSHVSIGFEVSDLKKTAKELEAKGVVFEYMENEVNLLAFFKDPDGTHLYLTQVR